MAKLTHLRLSDLRGLHRLANDATVGITDLVEAMHHTIVRMPGAFGDAPMGRTRGITGRVYASVRAVTRLVGSGLDAVLDLLPPVLAERPSSGEREAVLAALNGVLGDYLAASGNPLAIAMRLRRDGVPLTLTRPALADALPDASGKLLVMVHGLCLNDLQWRREGHDHGAALACAAGYTRVYLHYNTGRRIADNGREFGDLMEALIAAWPGKITDIAIIGHSMGGLIARSACHYAALAGHGWPRQLDSMIFLGTPHLGAPLERAGAMADYLIGISPYSAPFARLGKIRSAGIQDLRYGTVLDGGGPTPPRMAGRIKPASVPLPAGVRCYAIAASTQAPPASMRAKLRGDGLVPVASALGRHREPARDLAIPERRRFIAFETDHFELLERREVCDCVLGWLTEPELAAAR